MPSTTYVPVTVDRYDHAALFFRKLKPSCLGYMGDELTVDDRQEIGTNYGHKIAAARKGSPLFWADVLPGDIILELNGNILLPGEAGPRLRSGETTLVKLYRKGAVVEKVVTSGDCSA